MVRDHPVKKEDVKGEWFRNHIESENCCGSAEFIKLYGEFDSFFRYDGIDGLVAIAFFFV